MKIIEGDCLEVMRAMPTGSVDLVMCSPPYGAARTYGIGFAHKDQTWVDWALVRYMECLRVSKGLVCWVVEGSTKNYRYDALPILLMADLHRAGVHLRKPPAYKRVGIPGSGGPDWFRNDYEFCICATNGGKLPWSNNTACGHPPKWAPGGAMAHRLPDGARVNQWGRVGGPRGGGNKDAHGNIENGSRPSHRLTRIEKLAMGAKPHTKRDAGEQANGEAMRAQAYLPPAIANPGNVIEMAVGGGRMGSKLAHENEAPYPERLAEFFIKSCCPPGGTVLDPFCGSGTTLAVAARLGRNAIGIDIRPSQVELSGRRVAEREAAGVAQ